MSRFIDHSALKIISKRPLGTYLTEQYQAY